mmetsp:Transcript_36793/g.67452  ORF Transcript_36793/g.67452 Transcript_36793/m.67452 type:complete len:139 (+) Transcript_36793:25-441(+)
MRQRGRDLAMRASDATETDPISKAGGYKMWTIWGASAFYALIGVAFLCRLTWNLATYGLFPFQMDSAAWAGAWLITTVGDYYVVAFCFSGIVIATEGLARGLLWALAINLLGSPCACVYMIYRLLSQRSLALTKRVAE